MTVPPPPPSWAHGVGLRRPHYEALQAGSDRVDFLEVVTENFMSFGGRPRQVLEGVRRHFPVVLHGVGLSIGSLDPLNPRYLEKLEALVEWLEPEWFSDHLSYSSAFGVEYHDLLPLPFTREAIDHVVPRVRAVQERIGLPFLLENPSYYVELPGAEMPEHAFLRAVLDEADCGLLLDINNVYVNATNHGYDPLEFLDALPLERVAQVHIAGHDASGTFLVDTHGDHVPAPVMELYAHLCARAPAPFWTLLEWDHHIPTLEGLLAESDAVREVWRSATAGRARAEARG